MPGTGQARLGQDRFVAYLAVEGFLWTRYLAHRRQGIEERRDYRELPVWLRESYPELFAHPRLNERLALYSLAYDLRELLLRPPRRPIDQLPTHHPYNRIRRLVEMRRAAHSNLW